MRSGAFKESDDPAAVMEDACVCALPPARGEQELQILLSAQFGKLVSCLPAGDSHTAAVVRQRLHHWRPQPDYRLLPVREAEPRAIPAELESHTCFLP